MTDSTPTEDDILDYIADLMTEMDIAVDDVIVFGSTARGERTADSDTDIIVVSEDYDEARIYKRAPRFLEEWDYDTYGGVDFLCLTQAEFDEKKEYPGSVIHTAAEEGVSVDIEQ